MLKNFATWFIFFGLSFLVESWGWTEQGKAFLYLKLGVSIAIILIVLGLLLIAGFATGEKLAASGLSLIGVLYATGLIAIILLATYGATLIFGVDFYVAYQIMTFGQCLYSPGKKKDD